MFTGLLDLQEHRWCFFLVSLLIRRTGGLCLLESALPVPFPEGVCTWLMLLVDKQLAFAVVGYFA